jgi:hypothetical protein
MSDRPDNAPGGYGGRGKAPSDVTGGGPRPLLP